MESPFYHISLADLLDNDLSSYEYYNSLPEDIRRKIEERDIGSFQEMQSYVAQLLPNRGDAQS